MRVLRVKAEGFTASFRYPHFAQGVHPTFELPPPSTLFGYIVSAVGDWVLDVDALRVGFTFTHQKKFEDIEHLHFKGTVNPFRRELLFCPQLTLYIDYPDLEFLESSFLSPAYPVVLGRSQDLMTQTSIQQIDLFETENAYFEGTLLPPGFAPAVEGSTVTATMARYIDLDRQPTWGAFAQLRGRAVFPVSQTELRFESLPTQVWADPDIYEHPNYPDLPRGVWLHSFVEGE